MKKRTIAVFALTGLMYACGSHNSSQEMSTSEGGEREYAKEEADAAYYEPNPGLPVTENTESYAHVEENHFLRAEVESTSTFSIDVDNASYSNIRRFLTNNQIPPADAVRIEEMVNYFDYDYPAAPSTEEPFSITTEVAQCPWNSENLLMHVGIQGYTVATEELPESNLVFLIDVSGSMNSPNKLGLLKQSFKQLIGKLSKKDHVSIVVYAGSSGVVLEPTGGDDKLTLYSAIDALTAGGSTAGAEGLELAYQIAERNLTPTGNNRVILATDGDFNVGPQSDDAMQSLIEEKRDKGIYITVLGFGMGNYKDSKMEIIADHGNGNYFYIDDLAESKKVLVDNLAGTLLAIAKDVKIQVEFNDEAVKAYRLIGYENRVMENEDFEDDTKDAGELGAGHTVTAMYEIVPGESANNELGEIRFRYKLPYHDKSRLIVHSMNNDQKEYTSNNFRFSAAVASFGMLLKNSKYSGTATFESVIELASSALGDDPNGYRQEFIGLIKSARELHSVASLEY